MWPASLPGVNDPELGTAVHAEEMICLARTCARPSLLKRAFYELLRAPRLGRDPDLDVEMDDDEDIPAERRAQRISRADLARLIRAREELAAEWARGAALPPDPRDFPCSLLAPPLARTPEAEACAAARDQAMEHWRGAVYGSGL